MSRADAGTLERRPRDLGASISSWSNGPRDRYPVHGHGYDKVVVALSGSITFLLPGTTQQIELLEGDRLDLPAGTSHAAIVGEAGVRCLEGHLQAGRLGDQPVRVAGWADDATSDITARSETARRTGT